MCEEINFKKETKYIKCEKELIKIKYFNCYHERNYADEYPKKKKKSKMITKLEWIDFDLKKSSIHD